MKILVLGASGMLGNVIYRYLSKDNGLRVFGTIRSDSVSAFFDERIRQNLVVNIDVDDINNLKKIFEIYKPNIIINCIGLIKQLDEAHNPIRALEINALLPHRLAELAKIFDSRLIHISTDCVFSGDVGGYLEDSFADCDDLYGRSKFLGEVVDSPNAITIRTSIIGHEISSKNALLEWFLSQNGPVNGFRKAIFSGVPTVELARVIHEYVLPNSDLSGLFHVSSKPIDKYTLLSLIADVYHKNINIIPSDQLVINRSLDSSRFQKATGYNCPEWLELVNKMYLFH